MFLVSILRVSKNNGLFEIAVTLLFIKKTKKNRMIVVK